MNDIALEGKGPSYKERVANRQERNETESRARQVWYKQVRPKVKEILTTACKTIEQKNLASIKKSVPDFRVNTNVSEMLTDLFDDQYARTEIVSSHYEGIEEKDWDKTIKILSDACDKIEAWVGTNAIPKLNHVIPGWHVSAELIDDTAAVYIEAPNNFMSLLASRFTSFDAFLVDIQGWDTAIEEATYKEAAKDAGKAVLLIGSTAACIVSHHFIIGFWLLMFGGFSAYCAVDEFKGARYTKRSRKDPTPAEQESLKVFNEKYAALVQQEGTKLAQLIQSQASDFDAIGLKVMPGKKQPSSKSPYAKMAYNSVILKPKVKPQHYAQTYALKSEAAKKLQAYADELEEKYDGKMVMTQCCKDSDIYIAIEFKWVDRDGIILPNLR